MTKVQTFDLYLYFILIYICFWFIFVFYYNLLYFPLDEIPDLDPELCMKYRTLINEMHPDHLAMIVRDAKDKNKNPILRTDMAKGITMPKYDVESAKDPEFFKTLENRYRFLLSWSEPCWKERCQMQWKEWKRLGGRDYPSNSMWESNLSRIWNEWQVFAFYKSYVHELRNGCCDESEWKQFKFSEIHMSLTSLIQVLHCGYVCWWHKTPI